MFTVCTATLVTITISKVIHLNGLCLAFSYMHLISLIRDLVDVYRNLSGEFGSLELIFERSKVTSVPVTMN